MAVDARRGKVVSRGGFVGLNIYRGERDVDANKDNTTEGSEKSNLNSDLPATGGAQDDGEFKIEIRKLEVPVRPRGVLAE
jgi:hypothetical protein